MKVEFVGVCKLELEYMPGANHSKHSSTKILLEVDPRLKKSAYLDNDELPNKEGSKVLTNVLVQGLVANIHSAHEAGFRDSAEHLRFIISELERGFSRVAKVNKHIF